MTVAARPKEETAAIMATPPASRDRRRIWSFILVGFGLVAAYAALHDIPWRGDVWIHTIMETVATLLAALVGVLALLRYYTRRANAVLFVGAGFLGTAFLDGYHTVVTSAFFRPYMPSDLPSLIPWSWVASRQFLAIFLFLSLLAWLREHRRGDAGIIKPGPVYVFTGALTLASFLFFAFAPLPRAYYPELLFSRPEEFGPALFFLLALIGYVRQGEWRRDASAYWLVMALIVGFVGQAAIMSDSGQLFDLEFALAHVLKTVSYVCVLTGQLVSMYGVFKQAEASERRTYAILDTVPEGILTIDAAGNVQSINPGAQKIFGYDTAETIGRNVSMLMPEATRREHDVYIGNYIGTGKAKILGIGREVTGLRKNGQSFPLWLSIGEFRFENDRWFVGVVRDVTEQKKVDRMKNEFISTVSHELRTPLTSIVGSLGLVKSGAAGALPEKALTMIDIAYNNSDRLVRLINDMLDIEKIQSGSMTFRMKPLEMHGLIRQSIAENKGFADLFSVGVAFRHEADEIWVTGDADRLNQVMTNLLSNAVKYSPKGGQIEVSIRRQGSKIRIFIRDRGPGIPEEFQDRIFGKFAQADASDSRQMGGTGLGLNICQAIIDHHDGEIGFTTSSEAGTTFYFELDAMTAVGGESDAIRAPAAARKILICEDEADTANLLSIILEQGGYRTETAASASEAYAKLAAGDFAAMTLDLSLPDRDGIALIRRVRRQAATRDLPIIVVSARAAGGKHQINGDAVGMVDWLDKPIDAPSLLTALRRAFGAGGAGQPRVLHVEDDPDILEFVATLIGDLAEVRAAGTIRAARRMLARENFDLVILDLMLPDGNGEELLTALRRPDGSPVNTIVFSAREVSEDAMSDAITTALLKSRTTNETLIATIRELIGDAATIAKEPVQ